jgi:hypothetical protein
MTFWRNIKDPQQREKLQTTKLDVDLEYVKKRIARLHLRSKPILVQGWMKKVVRGGEGLGPVVAGMLQKMVKRGRETL